VKFFFPKIKGGDLKADNQQPHTHQAEELSILQNGNDDENRFSRSTIII
jgi:hypothetical protein